MARIYKFPEPRTSMTTCEDCGVTLTVAKSTKERPYVSHSSGLGETVYCVGITIGMCPAHGDRDICYPNIGEFLDMIAYEVAKTEIAEHSRSTRGWFLRYQLMMALEDDYPWLRRMTDPTENVRPPKALWFGYWIDGKLFMEFGSPPKAIVKPAL